MECLAMIVNHADCWLICTLKLVLVTDILTWRLYVVIRCGVCWDWLLLINCASQ